MIKKFKIFENKSEPKIGDYIVYGGNEYDTPKTNFYRYLQNNVGKLFDMFNNKLRRGIILEYNEKPKDEEVLGAFYDGKTGKRYNGNVDIPTIKTLDPNKYYTYAGNYFIKYWSENKEDCELYLKSEKYNI